MGNKLYSVAEKNDFF